MHPQFQPEIVAGIATGEQDKGRAVRLSGARVVDVSKVDELKTKASNPPIHTRLVTAAFQTRMSDCPLTAGALQ